MARLPRIRHCDPGRALLVLRFLAGAHGLANPFGLNPEFTKQAELEVLSHSLMRNASAGRPGISPRSADWKMSAGRPVPNHSSTVSREIGLEQLAHLGFGMPRHLVEGPNRDVTVVFEAVGLDAQTDLLASV
jgi:hypothetical protein